ncbi:MAG: DNA polymerase Y family protein [Planctomycetales bacterium]|nr:DNA polymerase Y family protein [Planctomycetales bacterium]
MNPPPKPLPRVLCIWLPNWPIQRLGAAEPQLASGPLLLSTRDARRGLIVTAVNLAGRQAGIRPAMRLSEATALAASEIREHDPQEDIDALCGLAEQAQQFSPLVGLEQLDKKLWAGRTLPQAECLLLDISGIARLFGGELALLQEIAYWLARQNYFGCLGLAGSVGTAWALANYGTRLAGTELSTSGPALVPPCRYCLAPVGEDVQAIAHLPLSALRLEHETVQSLARLGIRAIGQLAQLPRAGMATRLGESLLRRWDQARGQLPEPVVALHSLPDWSLEQTLEYPTSHRATIAELVRRLSGELAGRLNRRGEGALRLVCRLDLVEAPPLVLQLGLFRPTGDAEHLELLLGGQLDQQLRGPAAAAPLWRLSLQATLTAPLVWRQVDLFDGGESANRQQLARLVDTLSSRLGRKQVLSAQVRRDAQPELGYTLRPMTGRRSDGREQETVRKLSSRLSRGRAEPAREDPLRRPTQLFSPPREIEVSAHATAATPQRFRHLGAWQTIVASNGPERLESGWWRGPSARRDYYRVVTELGGWWWLYRDLHSGKWHLHGVFD